jgi:hypothetical protein
MYDDFIRAINDKKIVGIVFNSKEEGQKTRKCVPFDYGPSRRNLTPNPDRYHFYDLNPDEGQPHNLSIVPEQLTSLNVTEESFDPGDYVKWTPNWFIERDWGNYS